MFKLFTIFVVVVLGIVVMLAVRPELSSVNDGASSGANRTIVSKPRPQIAQLEIAQPESLVPNGELAEIFSIGGDSTDLQRQLKFQEIHTKIVDWTLPVYEVKASGRDYLIQTSRIARGNPLGEQFVGTFLHVLARDAQDRQIIERLKTGDNIRVKGAIDDVTARHLEINPAILVRAEDEAIGRQVIDKARLLEINPANLARDEAEAIGRQVMKTVYGVFDQKKACWIDVDEKSRQRYCIKSFRTDKVATSTGVRYYVRALGSAIKGTGAPTLGRDTEGAVGLFVVEVRNGQHELIPGTSAMLLGQFGDPPKDWQLIKLGAPDYWGWYTKTGDISQGGGSLIYRIFAPRGYQIRELARDLLAELYREDADDPGTALVVGLKVDAAVGNRKVFPLLLTMTGKSKGIEVTPKTWAIPFDEAQWRYVVP